MKTLRYKEITGNAQDFVKTVRIHREPIQILESNESSLFIFRQEDLENLLLNRSPVDTRPPLTSEQIERIEQGFTSIEEGRCMTHEEHKKDMREWLKREHNVTL